MGQRNRNADYSIQAALDDILCDVVCDTRSTKQVIVHLEDGSAMVRLAATPLAVERLKRCLEALAESAKPKNIIPFRKLRSDEYRNVVEAKP